MLPNQLLTWFFQHEVDLKLSACETVEMASEKTKALAHTDARWTNQVVRTSDGRFVVRGVDVPMKGDSWSRVVSGRPLKASADQDRSASTGKVLAPVTSKSKALATAKRAGLVSSSKVSQVKR